MATPQELLNQAAPVAGTSEEGDGLVRHYLFSKSDVENNILPGIYRRDKSAEGGKVFVKHLSGILHDLRIGTDNGNDKHNIDPYYYLDIVIALEHEGEIVPVATLKVPFEDQKFGDIVNRLLGGDPVAYQAGTAPISLSLYASKRMDKNNNPYASIGITEEAYTQKGYEWKYKYDEVDPKGENPRTGDDDWRTVRIFWIKKFMLELMPLFNGGEAVEVPRHPAMVKAIKAYMTDKLEGKTPGTIESKWKDDLSREFKVKVRHAADLAELKRHFDEIYMAAGGKTRIMGSVESGIDFAARTETASSSGHAETPQMKADRQAAQAARDKVSEAPPSNFPPASAEPQAEADDDLPF